MVDQIDFLKKNQRNLLSKKRQYLKNQADINFDFFLKTLLSLKCFDDSKIIASFLSINSEISTTSLNKFIENQGKKLCLPVISKESNRGLTFKSYSSGDALVLGKYNVKEPLNGKICLPDLIFTPCLGFDMNGFRLGYGGGYYDKTISNLNAIGHHFLTIGFAYDDQRVNKVFNDDYDQKLNYILTEKQLYEIL